MYKVKGIMYMIHSVALVIADFLFSKDVITEEEKEVCAYGMELIISGIISVALVIIIGLITGSIWYAVVYNIMMIVIRLYTGGYHADTHVGCNVCYCGTYMISLLMLRIQMYVKGTIITWLIALAGYLIIVLNAPLEHHNKKLTMEQKEKYMIVSAVLGIASMLISFILNIILYATPLNMNSTPPVADLNPILTVLSPSDIIYS